MLNFGQELYRLTERDMSTLAVDPFFRVSMGSIAALSTTSSADLVIPKDRCLFLHSFVISLDPCALATWESLFISFIDSNGTALPSGPLGLGSPGAVLQGENQANSGVGIGVRINRLLQLVCPSFLSAIRLTATRANTTNVATFALGINGYMIPPGQIGRA